MKTLKNLKYVIVPVFLALLVMACDSDDSVDVTPTEEQNLVEIAAADPQFSTLVSALQRTNLTGVLEGTGPFTVFAPTNDAFTALGVDLSTLTDAELTNILLYHVIGGAGIASTDLSEGQTYASTASASGPSDTQLSLLIERAGTSVTLNGGTSVTSADITGANGIIHVIDKVLLPLDVVGHAAANSNFTTLVSALGTADGDLVTVLSGAGPFTVFAPLNSAFEAISDVVATLSTSDLAGVLTYHVASGNVVSSALTDGQVVSTVNGGTFVVGLGSPVTLTDASAGVSNVVAVDVQCTNGVIHVIDRVLLP